MIAQQHLRLIEQLTFVFGAGTLITPPQLLQDLVPCRPTYHFIHSRHGNSHFWRNVSFSPSLQPLPGNKTFGAIRGPEEPQPSLGQFLVTSVTWNCPGNPELLTHTLRRAAAPNPRWR